MAINPYESPRAFRAGRAYRGSREKGLTRGELETTVVLVTTALLAGAWGGARYQDRTFVLALGLGTLALFLAAMVYAVLAKRLLVVLALPCFTGAVVIRELAVGMFFLFGVLGFPIAFLLALVRSTRYRWLVVAQTALLVVAAVCAIRVYTQLRALGARSATEKGNRIAKAIDEYRAIEGKLPHSLEDLVPRHLDSIPETGMVTFPSFRYTLRPEGEEDEKQEYLFETYELSVYLFKFLKFDTLVYWPEGNYPSFLYGGGVERMGDWAYVHE